MVDTDESPRRQAATLAGELGTVLGTIVNLATMVAKDIPAGSDAARDLDELITLARHGSELTGELADIAATAADED